MITEFPDFFLERLALANIETSSQKAKLAESETELLAHN